MTYRKLTEPLPDIEAGLDASLHVEHIDRPPLRQALLDAGIGVVLEDGQRVWVSCVPDDDPTTHQVEFFAVAIAWGADGPLLSRNGWPAAAVFTRGVSPVVVAARGAAAVRRAMMLVTLGLDPEVDWIGLDADEAAERSVRTRLEAITQVNAPAEDVL